MAGDIVYPGAVVVVKIYPGFGPAQSYVADGGVHVPVRIIGSPSQTGEFDVNDTTGYGTTVTVIGVPAEAWKQQRFAAPVIWYVVVVKGPGQITCDPDP